VAVAQQAINNARLCRLKTRNEIMVCSACSEGLGNVKVKMGIGGGGGKGGGG